MKKLMVIMLALSMILSFTTSAFASTQDAQYEQGLQLIEEANLAIDAKITIAVDQAEKLKNQYITEIRIIEEKEIAKAQEEIVKLKGYIASGKYSKSDVNEMNRKIAELEEKISVISLNLEKALTSISQDIEEFMLLVGPEVTPTSEALYKALEELTTKLNKIGKKYVSSTDTYVKNLNKVITDCYNVTLVMSNEAIAKAAEKGIIAECSWKLVRFGHLWVWIDPIRIVGRH